MSAYYNENDPFAAAWLRELIKAGLIADGTVDDRSINDVQPEDLRGFHQVHLFAGIGVWSYALRLAGWPDDRPIWTGSCPCQPFSDAGQKGGTDDKRHLWPQFGWLVGECRPPVVVGEQVASKDGLAWLDLVHADMEAEGYAFGAVDLCAAGVGAPHIRQRLWWVGKRLDDTAGARCDGARQGAEAEARDEARLRGPERGRGNGGLADAAGVLAQQPARQWPGPDEAAGGRPSGQFAGRGAAGWLADTNGARPQGRRVGGNGAGQLPAGAGGVAGGLADAGRPHGERRQEAEGFGQPGAGERRQDTVDAEPRGLSGRPGAADGFWSDADWLFCRDDKWRPVRPGSFPLVDGAPARVGRLRGYGNAINAEVAKIFLQSVMDCGA